VSTPLVSAPASWLSPAAAWTALLAVIAVGHHLGTLLSPLGDVGDAQWVDWIDLALPWCVVVRAGAALLAVPARMQLLGAAGLVAYVQGHGIHLAANSIANQSGGDTAYLWDELVGHAIWYAGLYLVLAALLLGRAVPEPPGPLRLLLAVAVGLTFATNALGEHSVGLALVACTVLVGLAWRRRSGNGVDVLVAAAVALGALLAYAIGLVVVGR
jgi:hypothetical protein